VQLPLSGDAVFFGKEKKVMLATLPWLPSLVPFVKKMRI